MKISVDGRTTDFDEARMLFAEARAIEKVTGTTVTEFFEALQSGKASATGMQALVWVAFKREDTSLQFSDVDEWDMGSLEIESDEDATPAPEADPDDPFGSSEPEGETD